jgi:hypothetical protein
MGLTDCTISVPTDETENYSRLIAGFFGKWQTAEVEQRPFSRWLTPNGAPLRSNPTFPE